MSLIPRYLTEILYSLQDARKATNLYAKMEYSVKKLLWYGS